MSPNTWLSRAADAYLKVRARAGLPIPLAWSKGAFSVRLMDGEEIRVTGMVSPPFASFWGTSHGTNRNKGRSLVHLASGRIIATLRRSAQARALASELAPALLRGELPDLAALAERRVRESVSPRGGACMGRPCYHGGMRNRTGKHPKRPRDINQLAYQIVR